MADKQILKVTKDVKWIGVLDYNIVSFDVVMETQHGTTYNSYFINAEKKAIIDTAKATFKNDYIEKVEAVLESNDLSYIILNHTEPDHSGCLKYVLEIYPEATVVGSGNAIRYLEDMIEIPFKSLKVKDGDSLDLGNKTLKFISAPNLHWPDTIYTYLEEDKLLFTCDSFGAHYCNERMFDDTVGLYSQSFKYYFDVILRPYSKFMLKAIEKIRPLDIVTVCPGHGPILRSTWKEKVNITEEYAKEYLNTIESNDINVLIAYVSAYGYTREMSEAIAEGLKSHVNINVDLVDIEHISIGGLESKIVKSKGILVGSPTINQNTLLPVYKLFAVINPVRDKGKIAVSFGSYGWSGEAVKIIDNQLKLLKLNVYRDGLAEKFYPFPDKEAKYVELGKEVGLKLIEECK